MTCVNCKTREATTTATASQLWGMRNWITQAPDTTRHSVCSLCYVFPLTMAGRRFSVLGDEPLACDICNQSWCKGRCVPAPEPVEEVETHG